MGLKAKWFGLVRFVDEVIDEYGDCELTIEIDKKNLGLLKDIKVEDVARPEIFEVDIT
jgi:GTP-binding protein HflX